MESTAIVNEVIGKLATQCDEIQEDLSIFRQLVDDDVNELRGIIRASGLYSGVRISKGETRKVHRIEGGLPAPPTKWKAKCGWAFGGAYFRLAGTRSLPACKRCWPELFPHHPHEPEVSASSSESESEATSGG